MLARGFTTIRDVGGANKHYKDATAEWLIPGPRVFQGGPVMSQTGGHGEYETFMFFLQLFAHALVRRLLRAFQANSLAQVTVSLIPMARSPVVQSRLIMGRGALG